MTSAAVPKATLRSFRRPGLWLGVGLSGLLAVIVVSLLPGSNLPSPPFSGFDKVGHFLTYAALSAYAVMLLARMRAQALAATALVLIGIGLEVGQGALTDSRMADTADALANALGVLCGLAVSATPVARALQWLDAKRD